MVILNIMLVCLLTIISIIEPDFIQCEKYNKHKFLARLYWQKYQKGTDTWYAKEKEFGKKVWAEMQKEIHESFKQKHPQRSVIENGVRI